METGEPDPLALTGESAASLETILNSISSNIGRRRRVIVFQAFNKFFADGPARRGYPLDWDLAQQL